MSQINEFLEQYKHKLKLERNMSTKIRKSSTKLAKLPSINQPEHGSHRPSSSKSSINPKVDDLSNKLFSQLQDYDKTFRKTKKLEEKDEFSFKQITSSKRLIQNQPVPSSKKMNTSIRKSSTANQKDKTNEISKQNKNNQNVRSGTNIIVQKLKKPTSSIQCAPITNKKAQSIQALKKNIKSTSVMGTQRQQKMEKSNKQKAFEYVDRQIQQIYQEYLRQENLENDKPQTSLEELKSINIDIQRTSKDINKLQNQFSYLISRFGDDCIHFGDYINQKEEQ